MTYEQAAAAADHIRSRFSGDVSVALVLGSGLGAFANEIEDAVRIPYEEIPGFARSTVEGHAGQLVLGKLEGVNVAVQQGRFHYYEGYDMEQVMLPVRTFGLMGVGHLILTNAAGSLDTNILPGSLMLISDHLNLMGVNPLRGHNDERFGPRFPDMTGVYDQGLRNIAETEAAEMAGSGRNGDFLKKGVYCALSGPTYETPTEIQMYRSLGADAVGMSTVPEAIAARHMGMKVLGISCITNFGAGMSGEAIDHSEVMETGQQVARTFSELLTRIIARIGRS